MNSHAEIIQSIKFFVIVVCLSLGSFSVICQNPKNSIPKAPFDSLVRRGFNQMVSGQNDAPSLSNYAAFNPTDGKFSFNGFANIKKRHAINVLASGGLISENIGDLFEGGKINKNTDVSIKVHFRLDKPNIQYDARNFETYKIKMAALMEEKKIARNKIIKSLDALDFQLKDLKYRSVYADSVISALKNDSIDFFNGKFLSQLKCDTTLYIKCRKVFADSLLSIVTLLNKAYDDRIKRKATVDSLSHVKLIDRITKQRIGGKPPALSPEEILYAGIYSLGNMSLRDSLLNRLERQYQKKIAALAYEIPIPSWNATWLTLIGNWNRKVYRTYDASLLFANQIQKQDFNAFNFGIEFNNFHLDSLFHKSSFLNAGFMRKQNINLEDLETSKVTDTDTASAGSVTRQTVTEYNVYTDPIEQFSMSNVYVNYYRLMGSKMSNGLHVGANAQLRDNGTNVFDTILGYFFGFNNKTDKRLINTEIFIRVNDMTHQIQSNDAVLVKRTQIGLSVAVPILTIK